MQKKLLKYAIWLLSKRPHSIAEIKKKLTDKATKLSQDQIECSSQVGAVIQKLIDLKYLNDQIFAEFFIRAELSRKAQSLNLIKRKIKLKGIDVEDYEVALNKLKSDEADIAIDETILARAAMERKLRTLKNSKISTLDSRLANQKIKEKLFRHLASRGFAIETILNVLG